MVAKETILDKLITEDSFRKYYSRWLDIDIQKSIKQFKARCPFHTDTNPSLSVNLVTGRYKCFGCDAIGDFYSFRMKIEKINFSECLNRFATELNIISEGIIKMSKRIPTPEQIKYWNEILFTHEGNQALTFLKEKRGLREDVIKIYFIGFDPQRKAITVPVFDIKWKEVLTVKYFQYNFLTGEKSITTEGSAQLFGLAVLDRHYNDCNQVVITEGEFDAMILCQNGFLAVSGTAGANTWRKEWNQYFDQKNVVICYDSDEAGRKGTEKVCQALSGIAANIKCLALFGNSGTPEMKDPTDFFLKAKRTREEFQKLIDEAIPWEDDDSSNEKLIQDIEKDKETVLINPAQDYVQGIFYYTILIKGEKYLLSSNRKCYNFDKCDKVGLKLTTQDVDTFRFSKEGILDFLKDKREVNPGELFEGIKNYIKRFIILTDSKSYDFLSLWTMGTYVFRVFRYYPYIHLCGEKRSAKTLLMEILSQICFNGEVSVNATEAVIFRDVHANSPTQMIDEVETLRKKDQERYGAIIRVLNAGFSKSGGIVKRCGGQNKDKVQSFIAYSPKMLAGINELDDVLRDRTIMIHMLRKRKNENVERYQQNRKMLEFQNRTRDHLYLFGLTYGVKIAELYTEHIENIIGLEHLRNRESDIWTPIITLANFVDESSEDGSMKITDSMILLSKVKMRERDDDDENENSTVRVLNVLNEMVKVMTPLREDGDEQCYSKDLVMGYFQDIGDFSWIKTKTALTRLLKKVDVKVKNFTVNDKTESLYAIDPDKLRDYSVRYLPDSLEV